MKVLQKESIGQIKILRVGDHVMYILTFEEKPIKSLFIELNVENFKILINCSI